MISEQVFADEEIEHIYTWGGVLLAVTGINGGVWRGSLGLVGGGRDSFRGLGEFDFDLKNFHLHLREWTLCCLSSSGKEASNGTVLESDFFRTLRHDNLSDSLMEVSWEKEPKQQRKLGLDLRGLAMGEEKRGRLEIEDHDDEWDWELWQLMDCINTSASLK